jgi:hypothetical protein
MGARAGGQWLTGNASQILALPQTDQTLTPSPRQPGLRKVAGAQPFQGSASSRPGSWRTLADIAEGRATSPVMPILPTVIITVGSYEEVFDRAEIKMLEIR